MKSVLAWERISLADLYPACLRTLITCLIDSGVRVCGWSFKRWHIRSHVLALDSFDALEVVAYTAPSNTARAAVTAAGSWVIAWTASQDPLPYGRVVVWLAAVGTADCAGAGEIAASVVHPAPARQLVHFLEPSSIQAPQRAQCPFLQVLHT